MAGDTRPLQSPLSRTVVLRRKGGKQGRGTAAHPLRDYGIRIMQRYTKCVPFYRINYLALYSILSFIQHGAAVLTQPVFYHTRIYYSHASLSPPFVFASRMTHRRIIFAAPLRLLISSHAFLRVRSLSFFLSFLPSFLLSSSKVFLLYPSPPSFLFLFLSLSLAPSPDRREKDEHASSFCCSLLDGRYGFERWWQVLLNFGKQGGRGKGYGGVHIGEEGRGPTASVNCRCNNAPAESKDSVIFVGDFRWKGKMDPRLKRPFKEASSRTG